jgi:hypothetical protein
MRKLWIACSLILFTLGTLTGCGDNAAPPETPKDTPAAAAKDATKAADGKKASKPAPRKSPKPHSTSGK